MTDADRAAVRLLAASGRIELLELASGLEIRTTSWVGRLALGGLELTVVPKIEGAVLSDLLRYGYGLRALRRFGNVDQPVPTGGIQDLMGWQLSMEAEELLSRGLHREYASRLEETASPRGRIDVGALARTGPGRASLPCILYPRLADNPWNRALRGALVLAARLAADNLLRDALLRLARRVEPYAALEEVSARELDRLRGVRDRRVAAYRPAMRIAELLLNGRGASLEDDTQSATVPGFAFDMNAFFQRLLSRLLGEGMPDHELLDESRIRWLFGWAASANPRGRTDPAPRPDFTLRWGGRTVAVLDAKYRDLWETALPAPMLYQLALYAIAHPAAGSRATILYPTMSLAAAEQVVELRDPATGASVASVALRPVHLGRLREVVRRLAKPDGAAGRDAMARSLVA